MKSKSKNKQARLIGIMILLLVVGYHFGRPSLERMLGVALPAISWEDTATLPNNGTSADSAKSSEGHPNRKGDQGPSVESPDGRDAAADRDSERWELRDVGGGDLQSPAGLVYGPGPGGEHRVDHVLDHARDEPGRPIHGVFRGEKNEILQLIDEAYELIQSRSRQVQSRRGDQDRSRMEYTVDLKRVIGYRGGRNGARDGFPELTRLRLILEGNRVITAYPY